MTSTAIQPTPQPGLFGSADDRRLAVATIGPNWFASVMGTSIVATAAATLPVTVPGLQVLAQVVWVMAGVLLLAVSAATLAHWHYHPDTARGHADNPVMAHFYGAPPMGLLAFGVATHLVGADLIGATAALWVFAVLWVAGTVYGLVTAVGLPYLVFTRHDVAEDAAFGGWLMPVVPPMVSAATGALLVPELPAGQLRTTLFTLCWSMFGLSLLASLVVITLVWGRLARHKIGAAAMVPTLWIVLGPLGQSITAANNLGSQAHLAVPEPYATAFQAMGLVYGLPVWGFALMWAGIALAVTVRTARAHLPFTLTWWSFTFPVGTVVTGTSGLALHTGETFLQVAAVMLFAALLGAWATVALRTARGVLTGALLR
ncbi:C4-dicarboxylate ABC transporter [Geodermatophilus sp. Leaf369]|uniref:TDT family transporter n=1 Tax=Geodermatophilaceae TaxID=85030 RepID=UPI0006F6543A|nr:MULTISPECIES: TDT family transporter [Geodermatophilaceae]KQS54603.1 C4-dicarboxylate ABC transporter [Geodermatophilus sp. Leaf369]KQS64293.1 C4-dicarboxylate ABC transporter [Modestobacter sp. Leaf380]